MNNWRVGSISGEGDKTNRIALNCMLFQPLGEYWLCLCVLLRRLDCFRDNVTCLAAKAVFTSATAPHIPAAKPLFLCAVSAY